MVQFPEWKWMLQGLSELQLLNSKVFASRTCYSSKPLTKQTQMRWPVGQTLALGGKTSFPLLTLPPTLSLYVFPIFCVCVWDAHVVVYEIRWLEVLVYMCLSDCGNKKLILNWYSVPFHLFFESGSLLNWEFVESVNWPADKPQGCSYPHLLGAQTHAASSYRC